MEPYEIIGGVFICLFLLLGAVCLIIAEKIHKLRVKMSNDKPIKDPNKITR